ncbi:ADAMTS-like protein 5 isoform X1 [Centruroides vittatus]|uniref:ADAMTS-like protein 5 isoform X1 n=1 Tax=Centruroides vittatus TaxID=120091 RepID=UPI00350EA688
MKTFFIVTALIFYQVQDSETKHSIKSRDTNRRVYSHWSNWSEWSLCTRTCGGGVRQRSRICSRSFGSYNRPLPLICLGDTIEYIICNSQDCPSGTADFREFQCSLYNKRRISDQMIQWVPQYGGENPCELRCQAKDRSLTYSFGKVIDGTRCFPGGEELCVNGRCLPVGCDKKVGSDTNYDKCGVCGGNNSTCIHYKDIYLEQFHRKPESKKEGYQEIAVIPAGATHIEVHDTSRNYLALRDEKSYNLNGNMAINWPGEYRIAGTNVRYTRSWDHNETLMAPGPTNKDIHLMMLFREKNPGVYYEYWLPKEKRASLHKVDNFVTTRTPSTYNSPHTKYQHITTKNPSEVYIKRTGNHHKSNHHKNNHHHHHQADNHENKRERNHPKPIPDAEKNEIHKNNALKYPHYLTDNQINRMNGKFKPTPKKPISISIVSVPEGKNNRTRVITNGRNYYSNCQPCIKSKDLVRHFCTDDFVLKVHILGYDIVQGETRYEANILQSYKNKVDLAPREYIWTPSRCRCPRMKIGQEYLIIGKSDSNYRKNESRLILDGNSFSRRFNDKFERRILKVRKNQHKKCKKFS